MTAPIFTGLEALDKLTGGFKPGELILLGARAAMGKTSFALRLLERTGIQNGEDCILWSLEESEERLARRLYALHTGSYYALDSKRGGFDTFRKQYINGPVWIDETITGDLDFITNRWRAFKSAHDFRFIIVDYIQLLASPVGSHICLRCLKACAQHLSVPIIVLSQVNQIPESRADKRPIISDLRWLESVDPVNQVLFLYREDYYYRNTEQPDIAEFILAKHPEGKTGTARVRFRHTPVGLAFDNKGEQAE